MKIHISYLITCFSLSLSFSCTSPEPTCNFIQNHSGKIRIRNIDSACSNAARLNEHAIPLFIYIADSLPEDAQLQFYQFSKFRNQSTDRHVALFIDGRKDFNLAYSENMKDDSLLAKRYDLGRAVYQELKNTGSTLELNGIYKKFEEIFATKIPGRDLNEAKRLFSEGRKILDNRILVQSEDRAKAMELNRQALEKFAAAHEADTLYADPVLFASESTMFAKDYKHCVYWTSKLALLDTSERNLRFCEERIEFCNKELRSKQKK